jgi:hypothetical protein
MLDDNRRDSYTLRSDVEELLNDYEALRLTAAAFRQALINREMTMD